ncbi:hypothetical protein DFH06DRAFT_1334393 [Mycena polygramma]|nr:hypothetical protein DFH06DRAFT_1334393 [Mycena polygramma]
MDSPFHDILHTNAVPSDAECDSIRKLLEDPQNELALVAEEISRLQSLIDDAAHKRRRLQQFIDAHLALVSPMRRLPDDILRGVFVATLPATRNPTISSDEGPLLLCRVCKSWRAVALTTPRLWAALHIVVPRPSRLARLMELVTTWLERSGTVPLEISMVYSKSCDVVSDPVDPTPLLSVLAAASRRWKKMRLILPNGGGSSPIADLSPEDVPLLHTMALCNPYTADELDDIAPLAFLAAETLRDITFTGTISFLLSPVSWGMLTYLSVTYTWPNSPSITLALKILPQCTVLQACELVLQYQESNPPIHHFSLPRLSRLSVTNIDVSNIWDDFFKYITLPNLRSFHLKNPYNVDISQLLPPLNAVESLHLNVEGLGSEKLLSLLADMPLLQELILVGEPRTNEQVEEPNSWRYWKVYTGDGDFLARLTPPAPYASPTAVQTVLCPRLRRVEFRNFSGVTDTALLLFVRHRTGYPGAHLLHVTATFRRPMMLDIFPLLQDGLAGGLVLTLKYDEPGDPTTLCSPMEGSSNPTLYMLPILPDDSE